MTLPGSTANYDVIYATGADLATYTGDEAPDNAAQLLRSCSRLVRRATAGAFYTADSGGLPTDAAVVKAFKDATCAQASAWIALGIDPLAGGVATVGGQTAVSKTLDGAAVTYAGAQTAAQARACAIRELVPDASDILGALGLLQTRIRTYG